MATSHAISRVDANEEIKRFLEIREEFDKLNLDPLPDRARYYIESNILSFVFYKDQLDNLYNAVDANAFRIYFGANAAGGPTLIIFPCMINDAETSVENRLATSAPPGGQYPKVFPTGYNKSNFDAGGE